MSGISTSKQQALKHGRLLELLSYDLQTGVFTARVGRSWRVRTGSVVGGTSHQSGYRLIRIDYESYLAHRLAWFYVHGEWPSGEVDHIDGDTDNNAIRNLRVVTHQQNRWNAPLLPRRGGILRNIRFKGPSVQVMFSAGRKRVYHKAHPTLCIAIKERNRIAQELYGEFNRASGKEMRN